MRVKGNSACEGGRCGEVVQGVVFASRILEIPGVLVLIPSLAFCH